jgi:hypothetical protein
MVPHFLLQEHLVFRVKLPDCVFQGDFLREKVFHGTSKGQLANWAEQQVVALRMPEVVARFLFAFQNKLRLSLGQNIHIVGRRDIGKEPDLDNQTYPMKGRRNGD